MEHEPPKKLRPEPKREYRHPLPGEPRGPQSLDEVEAGARVNLVNPKVLAREPNDPDGSPNDPQGSLAQVSDARRRILAELTRGAMRQQGFNDDMPGGWLR